MKFPDSKILIFCKAPVPGSVKTRLHGLLTPEQASELHKKLATETIIQAVESQLCPVELWCSPDTTHGFFQSMKFEQGIVLRQQQGKDLGERMHQALKITLNHSSSAIVIGTDCPSLTRMDLELAITRLEEDSDVVIAPTEDGGYALIGMKYPDSSMFENISWGTSAVINQTMAKMNLSDRSIYILPMQWDVDRPEDIQRVWQAGPGHRKILWHVYYSSG